MLQQFQLGLFDSIVSPLVSSVCGNNPAYNSLFKIGIAGTTAAVGRVLVNTSQGLTGFLYQAASIAFSSSLLNLSSFCLSNIKDKTEDILEQYDMDEYSDLAKPCIDIAAGFLMRKSAGGLLDSIDLQSSIKSFFPTPTNFNTPVGGASYVKIHDASQPSQGNFFSKTINGIFKFGCNTSNKEHNFLSETLDIVGMQTLLFGIIGLGGAIYSNISGQNKVNSLSVYDVRKILKSSNEIDKDQVKEISAQIFDKFKACASYYDKLAETKPQFQTKIDVVTEMFIRNGADSQKESMKSKITDQKLLEKAYEFVDTSIQSSVISRLIEAKAKYGQIQQINEFGISLQPQQKAMIQKLATSSLENEVKQLDCSTEEANAYKALYFKAVEIDLELQFLSTQIAYMQGDFDL
jgi:hypothetical protein